MRNFILCFLLIAPLIMLSACADTEWPKWLSGEPTSEELGAYKGPIEMPQTSTEGKVWPNLADVPQRPKLILKEAARDKLITEMKTKNAQGQTQIANYNAKFRPPVVTKNSKKPVIKKSKKLKKKAKRHG